MSPTFFRAEDRASGFFIGYDPGGDGNAVISTFGAYQGAVGNWGHDLHRQPAAEGEQLVLPAGPSHYYWPE